MTVPGLTCLSSFIVFNCPPIQAVETSPQWEPSGWGGGGHYFAAAFDPKHDGVIYMALDVGGVAKSTDHGLTWRVINHEISDTSTSSLAVDPTNPETIYAGTAGGMQKSTDGGEHWQVLPHTGKKELRITGEVPVSVRALAIDPTNGNNLYAASPGGQIYKSIDGGQNWTVAYVPKEKLKAPARAVAVSAKKPSRVIAATNGSGLLLSEDEGKTWTELPTPKTASSAVFSETDPNLLYASFEKDKIWKSTDAGKTWIQTSQGLPANASVREVAVSPVNPLDVYAIGSSTWISKDGGTSWKESSKMAVDLTGNPTRHYGGASPTTNIGGATNVTINPQHPEEVFISADWRSAWSGDGGLTWSERERGADISCITDIRFTKGHVYTTAMDEGTLMSEDNGKTWKQLWPEKYLPEISGHYWRVAPTTINGVDRIISAGSPWNTPHYKIVYSLDGGKTYASTTDGLPFPRPKVNTMWETGYPRALAVDPKDSNIVYLGIDGDPSPSTPSGGGLFKSQDGGKTWKQLPHQPASRRMFYGLQVDPTDSQRLYWGCCGVNGGIYRSDDGGATWSKNLLPTSQWVFNILVTTDGTVYGGAQNIWRSTDHGATWSQITHFSENWNLLGLETDPRDPKTIWASFVPWGSYGGGVYKTTDGGVTWQNITGNLNCKPQVLRFNPETNELWAGWVGLYKIKQ